MPYEKLIFILLPLLVVMAACGDSEKTEVPKTPNTGQEEPTPDDPSDPDDPDVPGTVGVIDISHYILGYVQPAEFKVLYSQSENCFVVSYDWDRHLMCYNATGDELAEYEALCNKHGDVTYNQPRQIAIPNQRYYCYSATDIVSIDLIASEAWGDRPAGTSWADLC